MEYNEMIKKARSLPSLPVYKNSTPVVTPGVPLLVEDVVRAGLIANLNMLLVGERGEGKTQLMQDINSAYFAGKGTYIRARPDMKVRDLYERFNLEALQRELSDRVADPFTQIDEINRAPPIVQNEFFHICDGYIEFQGQKIPLGKGFHSTTASANIGNGRYVGTFDMDDAILDRFHLVLNTDNYPTQTIDDVLILSNSKGRDPRVIDSDAGGDYTAVLSELRDALGNVEKDFSADISLLYLRRGLDFCLPERSRQTKSKRMVTYAIPNICEGCNRLGDACGHIRPISVRTTKAISALAPALRLVADAKKGKAASFSYIDVLEAFRLVAPFSDIIDNNFVRDKHLSNPNLAVSEIIDKMKKDMEKRKEPIATSFRLSLEGKLDQKTLDEFQEEWTFYADILKEINRIATQEGNLIHVSGKKVIGGKEEIEWSENRKFAEIVKKYPILGITR